MWLNKYIHYKYYYLSFLYLCFCIYNTDREVCKLGQHSVQEFPRQSPPMGLKSFRALEAPRILPNQQEKTLYDLDLSLETVCQQLYEKNNADPI